MAQMTPQVSKLLERARSLSVEEQEALADSLVWNLGGGVDEAVMAAWESKIGKRVAELDSGQAPATSWKRSTQAQFGKVAPGPLNQRDSIPNPR